MSYKTTKEIVRKYYKYGNNYIDTDYIPFMTSTTSPSGNVINTGSLELTSAATAYSAWGKNQTKRQQWASNNNISTSYTPVSNIPSGHYKLNFQLANYGKWATWLTIKFTLTYSDDTTEDIYTASSGFPPTRGDDQSVYFDYSHEFITSKPIKSIKFSGTSQIGNAGSGWIRGIYIQEQLSSRIPSTYKCLKSITGGRFDSNIQMTHNTSIEAESALIANDTNWQYLIDNDSSSGSWFIVGKEQTSGPFTCHFLSNFWSLGVNPTVNQFYHFFVDMSATTKRFYIDNVLKLDPSDSSTGNLGSTLLLNHSRYKSKYFRIYNSNMELEHYIVPVKRISDNKLGWYDTMAGVFYSDSWLEPITAYEELEYEEGTPSDYDFYEDVDVYKAVKEMIRKYYKYGTTPNATIVGTPTVIDGIVSNFSTSNYLVLPQSITFNSSSNIDIVIKFKTGSDISTTFQSVLNYTEDITNAPGIYVNGNYLRWALVGRQGTNTIVLSANTTYYVKLSANNGVYTLHTSTDGINWVSQGTKSVLNCTYTIRLGLGTQTDTTYFKGSIDLKESYIKIDGKDWWHGTLVEETTEQDYDFYEDVDIYKVVQEADVETEQVMPIPQMNSNSQDGFTVVANHYDRQWGSYEYTLFSPVSSGWYASNWYSKPDTIYITFPEAHYISKIVLKQNNNSNSIAHNGSVEITTDGSTYTTLTNFTMNTTLESLTIVNLNANCLGYKLVFTDNASTQYPTNGVALLAVTTYEIV